MDIPEINFTANDLEEAITNPERFSISGYNPIFSGGVKPFESFDAINLDDIKFNIERTPIVDVVENPIKQNTAVEQLNKQPSFEISTKKRDLSSSMKKNATIIYNHFKVKYDMPDHAIAGILGVLTAESGLNPTALRKGGGDSGIAQWVGSRKKNFERVIGKPVLEASIHEQLRFIDWELRNDHQILHLLKNAKSHGDAAALWFRGYENGGNGSLASEAQINKAYKAYYQGKKDSPYISQLKSRIAFANSYMSWISGK